MALPFKIFISSPGDVSEERTRAALVIGRLKREFSRFFDISSILWEYEPMLSTGHFQDIIDPPSTADIVVVILWSRLGTPLPSITKLREYKSLDGRTPVTGTEWEYEQALDAQRKAGVPDLLVYRKFSEGLARFSRAEQLDEIRRQWESLQAFWARYFVDADGGFKSAFNRFGDLDEFERQLELHLRELLKRRLPPGAIGRTQPLAGEQINWWHGSPYRGLQTFEKEYASVFFGRERAEREIVESLTSRAAEGGSFLLVLGASGSGKSSLVRAGLLPDLMMPGVVSGISSWRHAIIHPAELAPDMFLGLAAAILRKEALPELAVAGFGETELAAQLSAGIDLALVPIGNVLQRIAEADGRVGKAAPEQSRLVIVLDQLEILFTSPEFTDHTRRALDSVLSQLSRSRHIWIVATLRSDFFHRMVELTEMNALAAGAGRYQLSQPSGTELELIITRPAETAGLAFEVDPSSGISLASVIRDSAAKDPASLPLLSFVLDELYRRDIEGTGGNVLTYKSYQDLGGLEGAIARHAGTFSENLPAEVAPELLALLLDLVEIDETKGTATARAITLSTFTPKRRDLAMKLVAARLAVADDPGSGETVRLAHEALLFRWPLLRDLIDKHRDFLTIRRRLQVDALNWNRRGRRPDLLLPPGLRLAEAEEALRYPEADLGAEAATYAKASIDAEQQRVEKVQHDKEEALRQRIWQIKKFAGALAALSVVAVIGALIAWYERGVASDALVEAQKNYRLALDQATGGLQLLKDKYDVGSISTEILQASVARSQKTVEGLPSVGETDEVIAARVQLLDVISVVALTIGSDAESIEAARKENIFADRLIASDPTNVERHRLWTIARGRLSDVLFFQCDLGESAQLAREGAAGAAKLLALDPHDDYLHDRLLQDYQNIGDAMRQSGDLDAADVAYDAFFKDSKAAASAEPDEPRWTSQLAFASERLGDQLMVKAKPAEAAEQYRTYASLATQLVSKRPQSGLDLLTKAQAEQRLGDAMLAQGQAGQAEVEYGQYLEIAQHLLIDFDPSNFGYSFHVATAHQRLGEALLQEKRYDEALRETDTYLMMSKKRLEERPSNSTAIYGALIAFLKLGDVRFQRGELTDALSNYRSSLTYAAQLTAKKCQNGIWERALAMTYQRLGVVLRAQKDSLGALAQFNKCLANPIKPTIWSAQTASPRDVTADCRHEAAELQDVSPR